MIATVSRTEGDEYERTAILRMANQHRRGWCAPAGPQTRRNLHAAIASFSMMSLTNRAAGTAHQAGGSLHASCMQNESLRDETVGSRVPTTAMTDSGTHRSRVVCQYACHSSRTPQAPAQTMLDVKFWVVQCARLRCTHATKACLAKITEVGFKFLGGGAPAQAPAEDFAVLPRVQWAACAGAGAALRHGPAKSILQLMLSGFSTL